MGVTRGLILDGEGVHKIRRILVGRDWLEEIEHAAPVWYAKHGISIKARVNRHSNLTHHVHPKMTPPPRVSLFAPVLLRKTSLQATAVFELFRKAAELAHYVGEVMDNAATEEASPSP